MIAFVLLFSAWVLVSNVVFARTIEPEYGVVVERAWSATSSTVQLGIAALILRHEGVRLREIGLSTRLVVPALVAVGGVLIAINAAVAGLVVLRGGDPSLGIYPHYRQNYSLSAIVASGVTYYLVVGPAEELAFRGYLQNKLTALLGYGGDRTRAALGIVGAAAVFSLLHLPVMVFSGDLQLAGILGTLALLLLSGITFGAIYALTRNLYLVALLHGIGNWWPLFVDPGPVAWPNWGVLAALYALLVLAYRQCVPGHRDQPSRRRTDAERG